MYSVNTTQPTSLFKQYLTQIATVSTVVMRASMLNLGLMRHQHEIRTILWPSRVVCRSHRTSRAPSLVMRELVHTLPINSHLLSINNPKNEFTTIYLPRALSCGECFPAHPFPTAILHIVKTGNLILGFSWEERCHWTLLATRPSHILGEYESFFP